MSGTPSVPSNEVVGRAVAPAFAIVAAEAALVAAYFFVSPAELVEPRYLVYAWLWIDAGVWVVWRTVPAPGNRRHRAVGVAVGAAYFLLVMWASGNVGITASGTPGLRVGWYAPGWGPLVATTGPWVRLHLVPFEVVGYVALSYLVYANALDLTRGLLSSVLGLVTCVGCTVPALVPFVGLLGGPGSGLAATAYAWSYDVGTLVFLTTVGLLYYGRRNAT